MKTIFNTTLPILLAATFLVCGAVMGQSPEGRHDTVLAEAAEAAVDADELRFNFSGADWQSVLEWFSEQADLSLQLDQVPSGSFTFADPSRGYTISESMDLLNLSLMKRGYSLVRRGRMLQVIDLEAENADKLISEIAELVKPEELDKRGKSDILSCVFPLGSLTPEAAKTELALLIGPWGRIVVLDSARQVKVTETAAKLIAIRDLLRNAANENSMVVEIILKHRGADELLEIARPLLQIEPGQNAGEGLRISIGPIGDRIYATGLPSKTALLEAIIQKADQALAMPDADQNVEVALPVFRTHAIQSADSATVFDVLQTLLAGTPDARIAIDPKTNSIVAWARTATHELISKSIAEMEGNGQSFKVLNLRRLDPAQALLTINKFFRVTEGSSEGPIVDGDPNTGKLWIRGTAEQISVAEELIHELEGEDRLGELSDKIRILPYTGRAAEDALQQLQELWPVTGRINQIRTISPSQTGRGAAGNGIPERRVIRRPSDDVERTMPATFPVAPEARSGSKLRYTWVSEQPHGETDTTAVRASSQDLEGSSPIVVHGGDIVVQFTPAGMLIASEDIEALDAFEALMQSIATPSDHPSDLPTIFWLKYAKADEAAELISKVLGGNESTLSTAVDSVASGFGGGMLGGLIGLAGSGGGDSDSSAKSILTSTGSVSMVPDLRLNALIIQAGPADLRLIEMILEKIDRQESPEDVETVSKPVLIPVIYQNAKDIAEVVKAAFGNRIAGQEQTGRAASGGGQPSPQDFLNAMRGGRGGGDRGGGGGGGGGNTSVKSESPKISIAVDAKSNSLVVIATPQDFEDVRRLVEQLDQGGMTSEEMITTHAIRGTVNPEVMRTALESILGVKTESTTAKTAAKNTTGGSANSNQTGGTTDAAADMQRRIEFFRALRGGGAQGGGRDGAGREGRGGGGGGAGDGGGRRGR